VDEKGPRWGGSQVTLLQSRERPPAGKREKRVKGVNRTMKAFNLYWGGSSLSKRKKESEKRRLTMSGEEAIPSARGDRGERTAGDVPEGARQGAS